MDTHWQTELHDDVLNCEMLTKLIEHSRKNNPMLAHKTLADLASCSGVSESTIKAIVSGKNRNPRVATLKRMLTCIGGGSIDALVGLEKSVTTASMPQSDQALLHTLQERIVAKNAHNEELKAELQSMKKSYLGAREQVAAMEESIKSADETRARCKRLARWLKVAVVAAFIFSLMMVLLTFDALHPEFGLIRGIIWR